MKYKLNSNKSKHAQKFGDVDTEIPNVSGWSW